MARSTAREYEHAIPLVRGLILYICLIVLFGCVLLTVQASLRERDIRMTMTAKISEKKILLHEVQKLDIQIHALERYDRVAALIQKELPLLGPPQYPAIELEAPGLRARSGLPSSDSLVLDDQSWMGRFRKTWRGMELQMRDWMRAIVE